MAKLNLAIDIRDFDLERMGFSVSVLDESRKRQNSEAYLRMTLPELNSFLKALKAAREEIELTSLENNRVTPLRMPQARDRELDAHQANPAQAVAAE